MAVKKNTSLNADFLSAAKRGDFESMLSFFSDGAELAARDAQGNTALHLAAKEGLSLTIKALLDLGAEINALNKKRETPLMLLALHRDSHDTAEIMIRQGSDIKLADAFGRTALMVAEAGQNKKMCGVLRRAHFEDAQKNPVNFEASLQRGLKVKKPLTFTHPR